MHVEQGAHPARSRSRICLFAHFDPHGVFDESMICYVEALRRCGFDVVVITTSPDVEPASRDRLLRSVRMIVHRRNLGHDFGSWKTAMAVLGGGLFEYDALLLANDSVFGPLGDLGACFKRFDAAAESICGVTDNWEMGRHLQSYFVYFKRGAFHSETFRRFWSDVRLLPSKRAIIWRYEVGLSRQFVGNGFRLFCLAPYTDVLARCQAAGRETFQFSEAAARRPLNATLCMWSQLVADFGCPFVKREVLVKNPARCDRVGRWREYLPADARHFASLVGRYLDRTAPRRAS